MPSLDLTQPTTILAIYGAFVSTVVFLWNLRKDLRDRGRLSLSVEYEIPFVEGGFQKQPKKTTLKVVNKGRRACTLHEVGIIYSPTFLGEIGRRAFSYNRSNNKPPDFMANVAVDGLPNRLEYEDVWIAQLGWKSFYLIPYGGKVAFYAEDTLGRRAFTKRLKVDQFKDPDFEDESELPYTVDDKLRHDLQPPQMQPV